VTKHKHSEDNGNRHADPVNISKTITTSKRKELGDLAEEGD
jgi:hypothetical protein